MVNSEQIINEKIIMFRNFWCEYITKPLNTKEDIKNYIFDYIDTGDVTSAQPAYYVTTIRNSCDKCKDIF